MYLISDSSNDKHSFLFGRYKFGVSLRVCVWGCDCVCGCLVTDVHPVAAETPLHIGHVLSDSDGQQVVLLIIQYILILSLSLSHTRTLRLSLCQESKNSVDNDMITQIEKCENYYYPPTHFFSPRIPSDNLMNEIVSFDLLRADDKSDTCKNRIK